MREVRDQALPDRSHETDETSGMDLTQEERRSNGVGSGTSVDVGNRLDARKGKGRRSVGLGMRQLDARELECSGVHCGDVSWLGMEPEGSGVALGAWG